MRYIAQLVFVDITKVFIIVSDSPLHVVVAFLRNAILISDVIHQIVIVMTPEIWMNHRIAKRVDLTDVIAITVHDIDILKPIAICTHFPEG